MEQKELINLAQELIKKSIDKAEDSLINNNYDKYDIELMLEQCLKVDPNNIKVKRLLALTKTKINKKQESINILEKLLKEDNENIDDLNTLGLIYLELNEIEKASIYINKAFEKEPNNTTVLSNLGLIKCIEEKEDEAKIIFKKALEINPNFIPILSNLGALEGRSNNINEALIYFKKALELNNNPSNQIDLAHGLFLNKEWKEAWKYYEGRLEYLRQAEYFYNVYDKNRRLNKNHDISQKTILIYCEQGLGDWIMFSRYLDLFKQKCKKLIVHGDPDFKKYINLECKNDWKQDDYDFHCSMLSLPYLLDVYEPIPIKKWQPEKQLDYSKYKDYFKIGICWAGNPKHSNDKYRSCYLKHFRSISEINNKFKIFSLQQNYEKINYSDIKNPVDWTDGCDPFPLVDMSNYIKNLDDTIAVITGLDLIITVDTMIAHLSGTLGKKVFLLLPFNPDWRWGITGSTTEWYDTFKIFRQKEKNNWHDLFKDVYKELKQL